MIDGQGRLVELRPQAYEVLRQLALRYGRLVTKEDLLASVWPGLIVTDDSLVQAIGDVRRALGAAGHELVKTIPRRGYMLLDGGVPPSEEGHSPAVSQVEPGRSHRKTSLLVVLGLTLLFLAVATWQRSGLTPGVVTTNSPPANRSSIAVLPFKGPRDEPNGDVLARDVAADLVSELARSPDLRVVSSQSSFQFGDAKTPLAEIGRRLRSRYLVDGTVRRDGEQLRIVVELLDSEGGQVVWADSSTVDRSTLGARQLALVSRIAGTLQSKVSRTEQQRALAESPKTLDAYVLVARGRAMLQRYDAQGMRASRHLFEQALALDPDYATAWVYLGIANTVDIGLHLTGEWDRSRIGEVLAQTRRAIALQPDMPMAHFALAQAQGLAGDFDAMQTAAQRTCELSPNDADCFFILGYAQLGLGQAEPATRNFEQALDRNPIPPAYLLAFYATALWASRRPIDAVRVADDCLARAPDFWRCRQDRIAALVDLGRIEEAREEAKRLVAKVPQMTAQQFGAAFAGTVTKLRELRIEAAKVAGLPVGT